MLNQCVAAEHDVEKRFPPLFQGVEAEDPPPRPDDDIARIRCVRFAVQGSLSENGASLDRGCVRRMVELDERAPDQAFCLLTLINSRLGEVRVADRPYVCGMTVSRASSTKIARLCFDVEMHGEIFGRGVVHNLMHCCAQRHSSHSTDDGRHSYSSIVSRQQNSVVTHMIKRYHFFLNTWISWLRYF